MPMLVNFVPIWKRFFAVTEVPGQLPMLVRCTERESGGWQCDAYLTEPGEPHHHFVNKARMQGILNHWNEFIDD